MGTKTPKTMYEIAKAKAFELGILSYEDPSQSITYVGYLVPRKVLYNLFKLEGFTRTATIEHYIEIWSQTNLIKVVGNHIFIYPKKTDIDQYDDLVYHREDSKKDPDHLGDVYLLEATA